MAMAKSDGHMATTADQKMATGAPRGLGHVAISLAMATALIPTTPAHRRR